MAGCACLADRQQDGILITIDLYVQNLLSVAGRSSFAPKLPSRSGPVDRLSCFDRERQRFCVHPCHHQDLSGLGILRNGWDETGLVEPRAERPALLGQGGGGRIVSHVRSLSFWSGGRLVPDCLFRARCPVLTVPN